MQTHTSTTHSQGFADIPQSSPNVFNEKKISVREVLGRAWKMNGYRAAGNDGIPMACYRLPQVARQVSQQMNNVLIDKKEAPPSWTQTVLVPVLKKPAASTLDNNRGIALLNSAPKLMNNILLKRIQEHVDEKLRNEQNGFRPRRSALQHVMVLRRIMEEATAHKLEAHFIFVDYKKAFDSVNRSLLASIMETYGIPKVLVEATCSLYKDTKAAVRTRDGLSEFFTTTSGVLQGDSMAPFIFILFMDHVIRLSIPNDNDGFVLEKKRSRRHPEKKFLYCCTQMT